VIRARAAAAELGPAPTRTNGVVSRGIFVPPLSTARSFLVSVLRPIFPPSIFAGKSADFFGSISRRKFALDFPPGNQPTFSARLSGENRGPLILSCGCDALFPASGFVTLKRNDLRSPREDSTENDPRAGHVFISHFHFSIPFRTFHFYFSTFVENVPDVEEFRFPFRPI
jgi:hypothetical protein